MTRPELLIDGHRVPMLPRELHQVAAELARRGRVRLARALEQIAVVAPAEVELHQVAEVRGRR